MKKLNSIFLAGLAVLALSSCGGSGSSDGMLGGIPETVEKYQQKKKSIESGASLSNFQKIASKVDKLKEKTKAKLEKEGNALNGKECSVSINDGELKIESPLTWVYQDVASNAASVHFKLDGKIAVANDVPLDVKASDLTFDKDFFGKEKGLMTVKVPVHLEFLDKENKVLYTSTIGYMIADNNGEQAILKNGTDMDKTGVGVISVGNQLLNATSARIVLAMNSILTSYPQQ